jgi:thiamine pyrophosphokinase
MREQQRLRAAVFLNGDYPGDQQEFYRARIEVALRDRHVVAVDGALHLFRELQLRPHVLLGDFDSVSAELLIAFSDVESIRYPTEKDQTDGELALRYLLDRGYSDIEVYGAIDTRFETDQMLANVFTLAIANDYARPGGIGIAARLVDHRQYIYLLEDSSLTLTGKPGEMFSVLPISPLLRLTIVGAKWELVDERIEFGSTRPLRNLFAGTEVSLRLQGVAVVVHRHSEL